MTTRATHELIQVTAFMAVSRAVGDDDSRDMPVEVIDGGRTSHGLAGEDQDDRGGCPRSDHEDDPPKESGRGAPSTSAAWHWPR